MVYMYLSIIPLKTNGKDLYILPFFQPNYKMKKTYAKKIFKNIMMLTMTENYLKVETAKQTSPVVDAVVRRSK